MEKLFTPAFVNQISLKPSYSAEYKKKRYVIEDATSRRPFILGIGRVPVKNIRKLELTKVEVSTYEKLFNLANLHGHEVLSSALGYSLTEYSTKYNRAFIYYFQTLGSKYLDWLNRLAEADFIIAKYLQTQGLDTVFDGRNWCVTNKKLGFSEFKASPFLGNHVEANLYMFTLPEPHIEVIKLDDNVHKVMDFLGKSVDNISTSDILESWGVVTENILTIC